ncbi:MAG: prolyl oligopeptidase family serine peptidase [Planctomycetales bacterium]|nr:prolyl oligopeptidase family serine peptidase [Planctomycetales bacterium]
MSASLSAADHRDRFEARTFADAGGKKLNYRLLRPEGYDSKKEYPLVLFLHGAGERGNDNKIQLVHGMNEFAADEIMEKYPAFVLAPQCPEGKQWVDVPWSADSHVMPKEPAEPLRQSLDLIAALGKEFSIDKSRIYVTGLSMGGFGAWDAIQRRPELFAAAVPVCGGGDAALAEKIKDVPVWAFHGAEDGAVKPKRSRDMIAALKKAGGSPKYTEYEKVGHNSWEKAYGDPKMYEWLFAQKKK